MRKTFWLIIDILSLIVCVFLVMKGENTKAAYFLVWAILITIYIGSKNIPKA